MFPAYMPQEIRDAILKAVSIHVRFRPSLAALTAAFEPSIASCLKPAEVRIPAAAGGLRERSGSDAASPGTDRNIRRSAEGGPGKKAPKAVRFSRLF